MAIVALDSMMKGEGGFLLLWKILFGQECPLHNVVREGMNAFFDESVNSKTTLKQFVEQYENALLDKVEKENQADLQLHIFVVWRNTTLKHNIRMLILVLFEFRGVLCRHIIMALIEKNIFWILDKYSLRTRRKDVKRSHSKVKKSSEDWTAKTWGTTIW